MNLKLYFKKRKQLIDEYLKMVLPFQKDPQRLHEAVWYCMFSGGKRIRTIIMLAIAELLDTNLDEVLNSAAGIEMIHTSTLILDDLPSMDDALLRRGKPALHRIYGEAVTILVANVLMLEGLKLITRDLIRKIPLDELDKLNSEFISAIGSKGIMLGQFLDLTLSNKKLKLKEIEDIHDKKTSSLFEIAAKVAGSISGASGTQLKALSDYALYFGRAFQISDDIIASENKPSISGKLSLTKERRPNYISVFGKTETKRRLNNYIHKSIKSIQSFKGNKSKIECFLELSKSLKNRVY